MSSCNIAIIVSHILFNIALPQNYYLSPFSDIVYKLNLADPQCCIHFSSKDIMTKRLRPPTIPHTLGENVDSLRHSPSLKRTHIQ